MNRYEIEIQVSTNGRDWQTVHPSEEFDSQGRSMLSWATHTAARQNVVGSDTPGHLWRVRVRDTDDWRRGLDLYGDGDIVSHDLNGKDVR